MLEWDSDVLGFTVVKIIPEKLNPDELKKLLTNLKKRGVRLAYWASINKNPELEKIAKSFGGFLTGQRLTYVLNLKRIKKEFVSKTLELEKYCKTKPNEELINLIIDGSITSRFYKDPNIGKDNYKQILKKWITNSVKSNTILTIRKNDKIIAFVSLNEKNKRGNIDFIVVKKEFSGQHLGTKLMINAHNWFISKGYNSAQAVTQKKNSVACSMYEKFGYKIEKSDSFYHFWL